MRQYKTLWIEGQLRASNFHNSHGSVRSLRPPHFSEWRDIQHVAGLFQSCEPSAQGQYQPRSPQPRSSRRLYVKTALQDSQVLRSTGGPPNQLHSLPAKEIPTSGKGAVSCEGPRSSRLLATGCPYCISHQTLPSPCSPRSWDGARVASRWPFPSSPGSGSHPLSAYRESLPSQRFSFLLCTLLSPRES